MSRTAYKYLCVREDSTTEIIASQYIEDILDECQDWDNEFTSIIRQEYYNSSCDKCRTTSYLAREYGEK